MWNGWGAFHPNWHATSTETLLLRSRRAYHIHHIHHQLDKLTGAYFWKRTFWTVHPCPPRQFHVLSTEIHNALTRLADLASTDGTETHLTCDAPRVAAMAWICCADMTAISNAALLLKVEKSCCFVIAHQIIAASHPHKWPQLHTHTLTQEHTHTHKNTHIHTATQKYVVPKAMTHKLGKLDCACTLPLGNHCICSKTYFQKPATQNARV